MKKCVFAGTFDPPTSGHRYVIDCCLKIFDEVVVAVMRNTQKQPLLSEDERLALLQKLYSKESRVRFIIFDGAAADLLEREQTPFYVRGVRDVLDFAYENRDFYASSKLKGDIIEIYLPSAQNLAHVSSTLVRNSLQFKKSIDELVPEEIRQDFLNITEAKNV